MSKESVTPSFTESSQALDTILERFKSGQLPLEESLTLFEQGIFHINQCQKMLNNAKGKVEVLVKTLQESQAYSLQEMDEEDEE